MSIIFYDLLNLLKIKRVSSFITFNDSFSYCYKKLKLFTLHLAYILADNNRKMLENEKHNQNR